MEDSEEFVAGNGLLRDKKSAWMEEERTVSVMSGLLDDDNAWLGQVMGDRKVGQELTSFLQNLLSTTNTIISVVKKQQSWLYMCHIWSIITTRQSNFVKFAAISPFFGITTVVVSYLKTGY